MNERHGYHGKYIPAFLDIYLVDLDKPELI